MSIHHTCRFLRRVYLDTFASRSKLSRLLPRLVYVGVPTRVRAPRRVAECGGGGDAAGLHPRVQPPGENIVCLSCARFSLSLFLSLSLRCAGVCIGPERNTSDASRCFCFYLHGVFHRRSSRVRFPPALGAGTGERARAFTLLGSDSPLDAPPRRRTSVYAASEIVKEDARVS